MSGFYCYYLAVSDQRRRKRRKRVRGALELDGSGHVGVLEEGRGNVDVGRCNVLPARGDRDRQVLLTPELCRGPQDVPLRGRPQETDEPSAPKKKRGQKNNNLTARLCGRAVHV